MTLSADELREEYAKIKKDDVGEIFSFLEMALATYQQILQRKEEEEEKEEAIFNGPTELIEKRRRKKRRQKDIRLKKTPKKVKNKMQNQFGARKQRKRDVQQREGVKGDKETKWDKIGRKKGEKGHKGMEQNEKKKYFFRDKG